MTRDCATVLPSRLQINVWCKKFLVLRRNEWSSCRSPDNTQFIMLLRANSYLPNINTLVIFHHVCVIICCFLKKLVPTVSLSSKAVTGTTLMTAWIFLLSSPGLGTSSPSASLAALESTADKTGTSAEVNKPFWTCLLRPHLCCSGALFAAA